MKKVIVSLLLLLSINGCGDDGCCNGPVETQYTPLIKEAEQLLASGDVSNEIINTFKVELLCLCEGDIIVSGSIVTIVGGDIIWSYSDEVYELIQRHPNMDRLWRVEDTRRWMTVDELEYILK